MGSSEKVLALIKQRVKVDYPNIEVETYSPPYKPEFSEEDNRAIVEAINKANPDLLWDRDDCPQAGEMGVHALA